MVEDAVEHRVGERVVAEDLAPMVKALVGGHDDGFPFVSHRYELKQQVRIFLIDGEEADFVDDEDGIGEVELQPFRQLVLRLRPFQVGDEVAARDEVRAVMAFGRGHPDRDGEVGLARSGRAEEDDVPGLLDEAQGAQVEDFVLVQLGLEGEIVVGEFVRFYNVSSETIEYTF